MQIRAAVAGEAVDMRAVELAAGLQFIDVGMPEIAEADPLSVDALDEFIGDGRAWVAIVDDAVAGYVIAEVADACAHVEQVSVGPAFAGRRIGARLIDVVAGWARERGLAALTLTTFIDVPWNAPYYRRLGFTDLPDDEVGPELQAIRDTETAHGLDPATRVCMHRPVL
jgi:GNAT superfamily N-acetyltransferase